MEDTDLNWRSASYSSNGGGNCVEVAGHAEGVVVRDTQARSGVVIWFSPDAWGRFTGRVKSES